MIPKGLLAQIFMVIIAVAIAITYVQPAFSEIGELQDSISVYQAEREKVSSVNTQLTSLHSRLESVSADDQRSLGTYLPNKIDPIAITRDLALITIEAGVIYNSATFNEMIDSPVETEDGGSAVIPPAAYSFSLSVDGTYPQIKNLFRLLEQNNYPLELRSVDIQRSDGSFLTAQMDIVTFEYQPGLAQQRIEF